ncbi:MAG: hypothetical protein AAF735_04340 [Myxococcota bacterium]
MRWWLFVGVAVVALAAGSLSSCGDSESDGCDDVGGLICNDCSGSGNCDISCSGGESETCVGLEFFGEDNADDLRCAFCE